ncbi:MAG TPA: GntR family transcriptional regulator [Acidimicrobiia bacterium]|nr:GntR family transcriptional regulator [Acidimicrobiia bacterium]
MVATDVAPITRADWVDRRLTEAILTGELAPGERLVAATLAKRWSVSATPLREAFQRLAAQGLVETAPQRGARVAPASARDAEEIYELRLLLEPRALRDSLEHSDEAHRTEIDAAYERFVNPPRGTDLLAVVDAHREFHATLLARCRSRWLLRFVEQLAEHSQRYQLMSLGQRDGHHDVEAEHQSLRDAVVAGDVEGAVAQLESHLQPTLDGARAAGQARRA